jgi:hypothetical protein
MSGTYRPGSSTKNFGNGVDYRKLTSAISSGFKGELKPTSRKNWRASAGVSDKARELIPLNFLLYNDKNDVLVDELVARCIQAPYGEALERLALFALHLANTGTQRRSDGSRGDYADWYNEFIRTVAWKNGAWQAEAFSKESLDTFLRGKLDAVPESQRKVRNNYRHLLTIAGVLEADKGPVDMQPWSWGTSACKIFWDRSIYQGSLPQKPTKASLLETFRENEIYRLLSCSEELGLKIAKQAADEYLQAGSIKRFQ